MATRRKISAGGLGLITAVLIACSRPAHDNEAVHLSPGADAPFILSELRWDDALTPIARFADEKWVNTWPQPDSADVAVPSLADIPEAWLGGPVPRQWHLWQHGRSRLVTVVAARRAERDPTAGCTTPAVLDLEKPAGSPHDFFGVSGIAVNTGQIIDDFAAINRQSDEWRAIGGDVLATLHAVEQQELATTKHSWLDEKLADAHLTLDRLPLIVEVSRPVASTADTAGVYFFEASRKGSTPEGTVGFKIFGWIRHTASGGAWTTDRAVSATISDEGSRSMGPLAGLRSHGREFWLMFVGGIESSSYAIYEVTATTATGLIDADNGGC